MAHELENMFYHGELPWHRLGREMDRRLRWDEALDAGGLAWEVDLRRVLVPTHPPTPGYVTAPGFKAITRKTDDAVFGVVSRKYQPIQNAEAFRIFEGVFGTAAVLETAGSLKGGREVWGLARFPEPVSVAGDDHHRFLLVTTTHDGSGCLQAFPTSVRVVCANTLGMATDARGRAGISIRHTGSITDKVEAAAQALSRTLDSFRDHEQKLEHLADKPISSQTVLDLLADWFPGDSGQAENARAKVVYLAQYGKGNQRFRGTAYGLLQGVTDFVDHAKIQKGHDGDRRFDHAVLGVGARLKQQAMTDLLAA